jgi:hypothetical protein
MKCLKKVQIQINLLNPNKQSSLLLIKKINNGIF